MYGYNIDILYENECMRISRYMYIKVKMCCVYLCERNFIFNVKKLCTNNIALLKRNGDELITFI